MTETEGRLLLNQEGETEVKENAREAGFFKQYSRVCPEIQLVWLSG